MVNKGGDALEAPAQEAEINLKLYLADRMLILRTPETVRNFALKVLNLDRCGEKLKQVPFS